VSTTACGTAFAVTCALVGIALGKQAVYHCHCASYAVFDGYCPKRTVLGAGAAFHAIVKINNTGFFIVYFKNSMRTHLNATFAAYTFFLSKF
jgi:hypothetical protein